MQGFILALLTCSVVTSAIALIFMAIEPALAKRCSAKSRYYAWLIIIIALMIPFRPHLERAVVEISLPAQARVIPAEAAAPGIAEATTMVMPALSESSRPVTVILEPVKAAPAAYAFSWWTIAEIAWAIGAIVFLAFQVFRHVRFMRTTRRWSEAVQSGHAYELLQELRGEAGVARPVSLYRCPCVNTPMAMGIVHTRILLPHLDFDAGELRYVLMHELVHLKRKDLFYRVLTLIATAVHWFNPVVYMTGRATTLLSEISCDDEVVRGADADARLRYSETIIGVVKYQSRLKTALSTGFYGGKKGMKMRISSIMDIGKKRLGAALVCAALIMSAGTGFAFAATVSVPAPAVGQYDILDVLRHYESSDVRQSYSPPLEGQISRGEALDIAEASVSRVLDHLTVNSSAFGMGIASSEARLVQTIQPGQDGIDDLPGVQYGFWEVTLSSPDEEVAVFLIHAATGTVWRAEIRGWGFWLPRLMISAEKALSGFMTDLGLEGYPYPVESIITAREQIDTTISRSLPPDNEVFVTVRLTSAPYYVEGTLMDDQVAITLQLELTTQNGMETPEVKE